ncbi:hypothetical protein M6B38_135435 [Iris pallida]|uniref:Uncharacterized protein n=1 Tax=Iris pallida TaxID=29817 RepID=A0AAX6FH37_IRIPA|nr:hypothetical protein M6B38_135435 [Iris pallida]
MAYSNGGKSRFGFRFMSHETPNHLRTNEPGPWANSSNLTKSEALRGHVGKPVVMETERTVEEKGPYLVQETIYVVRPASPYSQSNGSIGRMSGSTEGSSKPVYSIPEVTNDRWARSGLSPAVGWQLRQGAALEKVTTDSDRVTEFLMTSVGPAQTRDRWGPSSWSEGNRVSETIDSREAAKKYGGYQL